MEEIGDMVEKGFLRGLEEKRRKIPYIGRV